MVLTLLEGKRTMTREVRSMGGKMRIWPAICQVIGMVLVIAVPASTVASAAGSSCITASGCPQFRISCCGVCSCEEGDTRTCCGKTTGQGQECRCSRPLPSPAVPTRDDRTRLRLEQSYAEPCMADAAWNSTEDRRTCIRSQASIALLRSSLQILFCIWLA